MLGVGGGLVENRANVTDAEFERKGWRGSIWVRMPLLLS